MDQPYCGLCCLLRRRGPHHDLRRRAGVSAAGPDSDEDCARAQTVFVTLCSVADCSGFRPPCWDLRRRAGTGTQYSTYRVLGRRARIPLVSLDPRFRDGIAAAVPGLRTPFFTYYVLSCRVVMSAAVLGFRPLDPIPPRTVLVLRLRSSLCVRWPTAVLRSSPPHLDSESGSLGTVVSTAEPGAPLASRDLRCRVVISAAVPKLGGLSSCVWGPAAVEVSPQFCSGLATCLICRATSRRSPCCGYRRRYQSVLSLPGSHPRRRAWGGGAGPHEPGLRRRAVISSRRRGARLLDRPWRPAGVAWSP